MRTEVVVMTDYHPPADQAVRDAALDPQGSFIVQAPAGSGKTALLIQRYLTLLTTVQEPEQIMAITFTVKAAGEMRARVLGALTDAAAGMQGDNPYEASLLKTASQVLERSRERGWNLEEFPARLRVMTIDAMNRQFSGAAPLIAGGLSLNNVADDPARLYRLAANRTLSLITDNSKQGRAVLAVLERLDNNVGKFETMLAEMLACREQWLEVIGSGLGQAGEDVRKRLEQFLTGIVTDHLQRLNECFPLQWRDPLPVVFNNAAEALAGDGRKQLYPEWVGRTEFPSTAPGDVGVWQNLAEGLLTQKGTWRKNVSVASGFPKESPDKPFLKEMLDALTGDEQLEELLHNSRRLPQPRYTDDQWAALVDLLAVLPLAAAELKLLFAETGETDYSEVAAEAAQALGHPEAPSDLALALDCKLQHILMDEFQDTSVAQHQLLEKLLKGWQPGDGRSLFLVGDPMQSIYRFRRAEVRRFLEIWQAQSIGQLPVTPLQLTTNFRSTPQIVDWVNATFSAIMPTHSDILTGAVRFDASDAYDQEGQPDSGVEVRVQTGSGLQPEADEIVALIKQLQQDDPTQTIGILVRGRRHAAEIARQLRAESLPFSGKDLEHMSDIPLVQDLLSLTRALLHPMDRLAWAAILRAPWCGLSLADLHALLSDDHDAPVWHLMRDEQGLAGVSDDGCSRLDPLRQRLQQGFERRGRLPLAEWICGIWTDLGGPASARADYELAAADAFFAFLESRTEGDDVPDTAELLGKLEQQPVSFSVPGANIEIMTVHKAKGLQFDSVILPGMSRKTGINNKTVLAWEHVPDGDQDGLLIAPMERFGDESDPLYQFIRGIQSEQDLAETSRLLYVAATRAKSRLFLFPHLKETQKGDISCGNSNSFAGRMLDVLIGSPGVAEAVASADTPESVKEPEWAQPLVSRLPAGWQPPAPEQSVAAALAHPVEAQDEPIRFEWAGALARHVGTVLHELLEDVATFGSGTDSESYVQERAGLIRRRLAGLGVADADLQQGVQRVQDGLRRTFASEKGSWVIRRDHQAAACELEVTVWSDGKASDRIIDRTFVADGVRWIVDYKSSTHKGSDLDDFIDEEKARYRGQLQGYRNAVQGLSSESDIDIKLALYFPSFDIFEEVT